MMPEISKKPAPAAVKRTAAATQKSAGVAMPAGLAAGAVTNPVKRKPGRPLGSKAVKPAPAAATPPVAPHPVSMATKPVAPLSVATSEGSSTMNDTIVKMQDTARKFTGEAGARAKGAYEKGIKMTEEMTEFQKGNVEAMVESSKLAAKAVETLGQEAADYARKSFESGTAAFKSFASAKSPTELFKLQSDYARTYFDSMVAESSKVTEAWLKIAGEVVQPLSNRVAVAVDRVKASTAF